MNKMVSAATFIFGAVIGSAATWYFAKNYYERIAQEEIDSVKKVFTVKKNDDDSKTSDGESKPEEEPEPAEELEKECHDYSKLLAEHRYYNETEEDTKVDDTIDTQPYPIDPDEFGLFEYDQIELTYYADGVLTDDWNIPIDDVEGTVGNDFADYFGEYEDDAVYIRNDRLKNEYCILADVRNHSEVILYEKNEADME